MSNELKVKDVPTLKKKYNNCYILACLQGFDIKQLKFMLDNLYKDHITRIAEIEYSLDLYENFYKLQQENKTLKKALELAVADKCVLENRLIRMTFNVENATVLVPNKEQWYLEKAKKELK